MRLAGELAQPFSLAIALGQRAFVHQFCRDAQEVDKQAEATIAVAVEHGLPLYQAAGTTLWGWAAAAQGRTPEGLAAVRRALSELRGTGAGSHRSYYLALLAELCGQAGQWDEGLHALAEAFAFMEEKGERWWEAELPPAPGRAAARAVGGGRRRRGLLSASACGGAAAGRKGVRAARRDLPGQALARPPPARTGVRSARPRLRVVHRGLDGTRYRLRTDCQGHAAKVFQAAGVAIPAAVTPLGPVPEPETAPIDATAPLPV